MFPSETTTPLKIIIFSIFVYSFSLPLETILLKVLKTRDVTIKSVEISILSNYYIII